MRVVSTYGRSENLFARMVDASVEANFEHLKCWLDREAAYVGLEEQNPGSAKDEVAVIAPSQPAG